MSAIALGLLTQRFRDGALLRTPEAPGRAAGAGTLAARAPLRERDRIAVKLTKQAINRSADIMGLRQPLEQALEIDVIVEAADTPESRELNEILENQGSKAAIRWREERLAKGL